MNLRAPRLARQYVPSLTIIASKLRSYQKQGQSRGMGLALVLAMPIECAYSRLIG
ncbi:hypothetical protein SAMN05216585_5993 [Pseudomonas chlororaphis]|nr:hypothetical protein SAMN05216585_5993 [Pseudomonas chlororaphis]